VAQERCDLVARAEHQHLATAPHAQARREPFAFEDRARTRRLAAGRTELEEIARWPGGDGAAREEQAPQVRSPAALAPQRRPATNELRPVSQTPCWCAQMLRAREQSGKDAAVAVGWAYARKLGLHFFG
jgi:hypothetical protein